MPLLPQLVYHTVIGLDYIEIANRDSKGMAECSEKRQKIKRHIAYESIHIKVENTIYKEYWVIGWLETCDFLQDCLRYEDQALAEGFMSK